MLSAGDIILNYICPSLGVVFSNFMFAGTYSNSILRPCIFVVVTVTVIVIVIAVSSVRKIYMYTVDAYRADCCMYCSV
jgi:hypothetical protein